MMGPPGTSMIVLYDFTISMISMIVLYDFYDIYGVFFMISMMVLYEFYDMYGGSL